MTTTPVQRLRQEPESLLEAAEALEGVRRQLRRFEPYPTCKPSGVDSLGDLPAHWVTKRLKYAASLIKHKGDCAAADRFYMGLEHVESWTGRLVNPDEESPDDSTGLVFEPDDVLFGKLRPYLAKAFLADSPGMCSPEFLVLRGHDLLPEYLFYFVLSRGFVELVDGSTFGAKMPRANWEFIGSCLATIPPLDEQRAIAAFLRRETAKIDALVEKKRRLIELLREKRTALISHAVTKGLNPDAPMKPSGIDWFDHVPAHWSVMRLKQFVPAVTVGIVVQPSKYYEPSGVPCLRSLNISGQQIGALSDLVYISEDANQLHRKSIIRARDIVIVRTGRTGTAAIVTEAFDGANCIDLVIVRRSRRVLSEYLHYFINSLPAVRQVEALSVGSLQAHYNTRTVGELFVPLPPPEEQKAILAHFSRAAGRIDRIAKHIVGAIDRLTEYRSALISAAVTGQIDVHSARRGLDAVV